MGRPSTLSFGWTVPPVPLSLRPCLLDYYHNNYNAFIMHL